MSLYDDRYIGGDNLESIAQKLPYHPQNKQDFEAFEELLEDEYILIGEAEDIDKVREKYPEEFI